MSSDLRKTQARKSHATHVRCLQYKKKRTYEKEKKLGEYSDMMKMKKISRRPDKKEKFIYENVNKVTTLECE